MKSYSAIVKNAMSCRSLTVATVAIVSLCANSAVFAAPCMQSDLEGRYQTYQYFNATFWQRCIVRIKANGKVIAGTNCIGSNGSVGVVDGGKLRISNGCVVKGDINVSGGLVGGTIDHAIADLSGNVINGVGRSDHGDVMFFTAIRK